MLSNNSRSKNPIDIHRLYDM
ncbi:hypothetical protein pipiens_020155, partial [Culex pipiens pipiens]